ncbi:MAG TPA: M20/M25/M40 family metallo-hydrolase [Vicinamibacteria bacterium]|nr:M20/M25/M40 family metallo-hydrolase [Vicinamibacteria bacterium]
MIWRSPRVAAAILLLAALAGGETADVRTHVSRLASEEMDGRLTGTDGARRASDYIIQELERMGIRPLPGRDSFRVPFEFTSGVNDQGSTLSASGREAPSGSVRGLSFSDNGEVSGGLVFAGYGITVPESQDFGYDSYFGLDVKNKIVLVLRYFPEDATAEAKSILARYSGLRFKAMNARDRGAKGLLLVSGPRSPNAGELVGMSFDSAVAGSGIVAATIRGDVAEKLFERAEGKTLAETQQALDSGNPHVGGFEIPGAEILLNVRLQKETRTAENVVGYLPATAEEPLGGATILLGAHYDHLGRGNDGNSLAGKDEAGQIHHGADDNASGVAAVLAIAEKERSRDRKAPVAFAFWAGEELGLLGSGEFVRGGAIPVADIAAYINFDMVGRMRDNKLVLQAVGTSSVWPRLIEQANVVVGFDVQVSEDPYLPTDVTSFNQAGVPSVNFFTGSHKEYHRPADRADLINYEDLERVVTLGALLTEKVAGLQKKPDFIKVARAPQQGGSRDTVRVFTGTIPDYATQVEGLLLSGVIEGGPAEEAGLRGGDVIVEFAGRKISNIYDYTYALDVVKIGEQVAVVFLRGGERRETKLTPRARK